MKTQVVGETEVHEAERALAEARGTLQQIEAEPATRSLLEQLRFEERHREAKEALRAAEERLAHVREAHFAPIRAARRERVRLAACEAVEAGRSFLAANMELLNAQRALEEVGGNMQELWFLDVVPGTPTNESKFERWCDALAKDGWLD